MININVPLTDKEHFRWRKVKLEYERVKGSRMSNARFIIQLIAQNEKVMKGGKDGNNN